MGKELLEILALGLVIALLAQKVFALVITFRTLWLVKKIKDKDLK